MKSIIIGSAGHVDHGKTRLIGMLTGTNTDRLKEEQQRGISIELGFARLELRGGILAGIVDVPGHERFVRTMVAGAAGMDMALLVVAADEGVMPQTREHVEVLELLGVHQGLVALTKIDMVDPELVELAAEDVSDYLSGTALAGFEIIPVSSETGEGMELLLEKLTQVAAACPERSSTGPYRLPIDRVFTLTGMGTVVTGTSWSGTVRVGDQLELLPRGLSVRVRGVQVHDDGVEEAHAGQRTALALHGVKHDELTRGEVVASVGRFTASSMITLKVRSLASNPWPLKQRARIRFHFGTHEVLGRLLLLDCESLEPGKEALAQARLEEPTVCAPGDRVILRFYSPMRTVAGAVVLEADAPKRRHGRDDDLDAIKLKESGDPAQILERAIFDAGLTGMNEKEAGLISEKYGGESPLASLIEAGRIVKLGKALFHCDPVDSLARGIEAHAAAQQEKRPLSWGPGREELRSALAQQAPQSSFQKILEHLNAEGRLRLNGERVRVGEGDPKPVGASEQWVARAESDWRSAGLMPPAYPHFGEIGVPADMVPDVANYLVDSGSLIRIGPEFLVHSESVSSMRDGLRELFAGQDVIVVADFGQRFEISRKYSVPLLEYSDRQGWTVRREAERTRGPSL